MSGGSVPGSVLGLGVDVVDVARFARSLERTPRLAQRLFADHELTYAATFGSLGRAQRLAVRFAAKEATMKALGVGLGAFGFHEATVVRLDDGRPVLELRGRAADLAEAAGVGAWLVSLSHTATVAQATVLAVS